MAYTLGDIASRVQTRVRDTSYSLTTIKGFINDTQNAVANEYWLPFWEAGPQSYTLTTNVQDITNGVGLPSTFVMALSLRVTAPAGYKGEIDYIDYRDLEELYPDQENDTAGPPIYWFKYGNTISVYPKPDQGYTVKLRYTRMPTQLSADADVPAIPSSFEELLIYGASARVFEELDMETKADINQNLYEKEVLKLVNKYAIKQTRTPYVAKQPRRSRYASDNPWC